MSDRQMSDIVRNRNPSRFRRRPACRKPVTICALATWARFCTDRENRLLGIYRRRRVAACWSGAATRRSAMNDRTDDDAPARTRSMHFSPRKTAASVMFRSSIRAKSSASFRAAISRALRSIASTKKPDYGSDLNAAEPVLAVLTRSRSNRPIASADLAPTDGMRTAYRLSIGRSGASRPPDL